MHGRQRVWGGVGAHVVRGDVGAPPVIVTNKTRSILWNPILAN
jgi:hypothetical protein